MSERKRKDKVIKVIFDWHGNPEVSDAAAQRSLEGPSHGIS